MSRSYKKSPVCKCCKMKGGKRRANKKVRQALKGNMSGVPALKSNIYRKLYESWDICDFRMFGNFKREESLFKLTGEDWEKIYRRK